MNKKQRQNLIRIAITAIMLTALHFVSFDSCWRFPGYFASYILISYDIIRKAFNGIKNKRPLDENLLMTVASVAACESGDYTEAVAVMLFYQIGELFQSYAVGKSRQSISSLMDIRPDYANIEKDGQIIRVDPDEVAIGSIIVAKPGEKIPIDGVVTEGRADLDTAALTGESIPTNVTVGDSVISGAINTNGVLKIRTEKEFGESTVSKILDLTENAGSRKAKSEEFIAKFARIYTPAVVLGAIALFILPPIFSIISQNEPQWNVWLYRALTFLVISCPCALVISIPLSFFAGIGGASRKGILVKGSNFFETLAKVDVVVFDKTGTLTEGKFDVTAVHSDRMTEKELLHIVAHVEANSNHPIAAPLKNAYPHIGDGCDVADIEEMPGLGIKATVNGKKVFVGNDKLMKQIGANYHECHRASEGTVIHVADNDYLGHVLITDIVKPNSVKAIAELKQIGVRQTVMLTGDNKTVAKKIAAALNIDEIKSELLPTDKVSILEEIINSNAGKTAFVGDGINDAPALSRADVGIAMGALGSDAAIDVVLMDDDPLKIVTAVKIARKCLGIVQQNIVFALAVKFACLILGAVGIANMWLAIFADVGVMILAILNAIRAMFIKDC